MFEQTKIEQSITTAEQKNIQICCKVLQMLAEKYNNFLIKSHFLGDDIWSLLGSWDAMWRMQKGLVALTGEILLSPVFYFLVI